MKDCNSSPGVLTFSSPSTIFKDIYLKVIFFFIIAVPAAPGALSNVEMTHSESYVYSQDT